MTLHLVDRYDRDGYDWHALLKAVGITRAATLRRAKELQKELGIRVGSSVDRLPTSGELADRLAAWIQQRAADLHAFDTWEAVEEAARQWRAENPPKPPYETSIIAARSSTSSTSIPLAEEPVGLTDTFWNSRPVLAHIRQAAHARQRSAPAVLHVVLARIAAAVPHYLQLPAIVGGRANLTYYTVLLAPPGVGKSSAADIGTELLPITDERVRDHLPIGSGEGFVDALLDWVTEQDNDGKKRKVRRQTRFGAFFYADEGQILDDLGRRSGSTLLPVLRSAWSNAPLGNTNANEERKRIIPAGQYTYGLVVALQEAKADVLLDDAGTGTPQRFTWTLATDPTIPHTPPAWPGPLNWSPPSMRLLDTVAGIRSSIDHTDTNDTETTGLRYEISVAPEIVHELRAADLDRARGLQQVDQLDAHAGLLQLKTAALLALLEGRPAVTVEDWNLAAIIKADSDRVRSEIRDRTAQERARQEQATAQRLARRAATADQYVEQRRIDDTARAIARKIQEGDQRCGTVAGLRRTLSRQRREVLDDALTYAIRYGWIIERGQNSHTGDQSRTLAAGPNKVPA